MSNRTITQRIPARATADGAGVKLRRSIGASAALRLDPFLMLDEILSDEAADYLGGFPAHPHRGFQTVTIMLDGRMQHRDHMGNVGLLEPGGAQWMTAGRGVIHEEMPQQDAGRLHGFQLWLNLPAAEKMQPARYRDIAPAEIPTASQAGVTARVIAGRLEAPELPTLTGPINNADEPLTTDPLLADLRLEAGATLSLPLPDSRNAFVYVFDGELSVAGEPVTAPEAALLGPGDQLTLNSDRGARLLLLAGKPLGEPVAQHGPFVMNTQAELRQAMLDYGNGVLTTPA